MTEIFEIVKSIFSMLTGMSKKGMALVCIGGAVIASMSFAIWLLLQIYSGAGTTNIEAKLTDFRREAATRDSINMLDIRQKFAEIRTDVAVFRKEQAARDSIIHTDLSDLTVITAANSNSNLLRQLTPHLENVATKQDVYRFIIALEKAESMKKITDSISIGSRKINHLP